MLPAVHDVAAYEAIWGDDACFEGAARALLRAHGCDDAALTRYRSGTAVCFRAGERVIKLYPPVYEADAKLEAEALRRAAAQPSVPSPRCVAQGGRQGWSFLIMSRCQGAPLEVGFEARSTASRLRVMRAAGAMCRELHRAVGAALPRADQDWSEFRLACRARAAARHVERGFDASRADELRAYLEALDEEPEIDTSRVLLHTELAPGHLLVEGDAATGLIDFGEAREGPAEYDLAAIGVFVTQGDRDAFAAFLDGYALPESRRGPALVRRLMRHALLHQYGHLPFYLSRARGAVPAALDELAVHWFGH